MSLENAGFLKERVDSGKPVRLADVTDVAQTQLRRTAQYVGLMPAIRNFGKIWGKVQTGYRDSLQSAVRDKFGEAGIKYIDKLMADLNGAHSEKEGPLEEFLNRARGKVAQSALTLSLRTALSQTASYPTAASVLGWKALRKALFRGGRDGRMISAADQELIRKWSPLLWYRMQGYSTTELGDLAGINSQMNLLWKKMRWATGWIQAMDGATVGRLWYAAEYAVQERQPNLKPGTDAYYREVAKLFNEAVETTQPNYTVLQRPDILRSHNALTKQLTMFLTQRLQNFNILYDAAAEYTQRRADLKNGVQGVTQQDVRDAALRTRRAFASQLVAAATITVFKAMADFLLHAVNAYRDKDDEMTAESVGMSLLDMFIDCLAGNALFGGEVYDLVESRVFGTKYYGIEISGVSVVTDLISSANDLVTAAIDPNTDRKKLLSKTHYFAKDLSELAGIPLGNAEKIANGLINHTKDLLAGEFLSFEAGVERTTAQQARRIYRAYSEANFGQAKKILEGIEDGDALNSAVRKIIKQEFAAGRIDSKTAVDQMVRWTGMERDKAERSIREFTGEVETGIKYSEIATKLLNGEITQAEAVKYWQKYGAKEAIEAKSKAEFVLYQAEHPNTTLDESSFLTYSKKYANILSAVQYESFKRSMDACKGVDENGDGKTDSGSKKSQQLLVINALPVSTAQKDQIYRINGWSEKTLEEAPWHTGQSSYTGSFVPTSSTTSARTSSAPGKDLQEKAYTATGISRYGQGNIDLYARNTGLYDEDGNIMTVYSTSFREGNQEVLVPMVVKKNGKWVELTSVEQARAWYEKTGEYLGKFRTVAAADAYANLLHEQQAILYS